MIAITNLTKTIIDEGLFAQVAKNIFKGENIRDEKEISVVFVDSAKMEDLNKEYRKIDRPTDVLSFIGEGDLLGEIVICPAEVRKNAKDSKSSFKKESVFVFIHGVLHLLGYDHGTSQADADKMRLAEKKYLAQVNF